MSTHTYKELISKAKTCQTNVKKEYKLGISYRWSYYFAKAILKPKTDIPKGTFKDCKNQTGTHAAGVIIAPRPMEEIIPVTLSKEKSILL